MRRVTAKEVEAVLGLDGNSRFERFIRIVADCQEAWSLWDDGWALYHTDEGEQAFPLWPDRKYADICKLGSWAHYQSRCITLDDMLNDLIPSLIDKGVLVAVFPTPSDKGVALGAEVLSNALREELTQYSDG